MEAMKDQITTMMEAMMSMRKMMEVNAATTTAISVATEVDPTHPSILIRYKLLNSILLSTHDLFLMFTKRER